MYYYLNKRFFVIIIEDYEKLYTENSCRVLINLLSSYGNPSAFVQIDGQLTLLQINYSSEIGPHMRIRWSG